MLSFLNFSISTYKSNLTFVVKQIFMNKPINKTGFLQVDP